MTSSEKILAGIAEDASDRAAEIISEAEKKAEKAVNERLAAAEKEALEIAAAAEKAAELTKKTGESAAVLLKRDAALSVKRELIESALKATAESINAYGDKEYFDLLLKLIEQNRLDKNGEVILSSGDMSRDMSEFKKALVGYSLTLSGETAETGGGFILKYGDIIINCGLEAVIREKRDTLTDTLNRELFG